MTQPDLCPHSRPAYVPIGSMMQGFVPCDDCEDEDWSASRARTLQGLTVLLVLLYVPLILLLCGVFW